MTETNQTDYNVSFDAAGADKMDRAAREVFAPIYPVLAEQIMNRLDIIYGWGLDIGAGPGSFGMALAQRSRLNMLLLDPSAPMRQKARENLLAAGLQRQCLVLPGDVHSLPLANDSLHMIISRGSIFFWEDLETAFREIYRVLAPSGRTYLGGGFGTAQLREKITREMTIRDPAWPAFRNKNLAPENKARMKDILDRLKIPYDVFDDDSGFWIVMIKEKSHEV